MRSLQAAREICLGIDLRSKPWGWTGQGKAMEKKSRRSESDAAPSAWTTAATVSPGFRPGSPSFQRRANLGMSQQLGLHRLGLQFSSGDVDDIAGPARSRIPRPESKVPGRCSDRCRRTIGGSCSGQ